MDNESQSTDQEYKLSNQLNFPISYNEGSLAPKWLLPLVSGTFVIAILTLVSILFLLQSQLSANQNEVANNVEPTAVAITQTPKSDSQANQTSDTTMTSTPTGTPPQLTSIEPSYDETAVLTAGTEDFLDITLQLKDETGQPYLLTNPVLNLFDNSVGQLQFTSSQDGAQQYRFTVGEQSGLVTISLQDAFVAQVSSFQDITIEVVSPDPLTRISVFPLKDYLLSDGLDAIGFRIALNDESNNLLDNYPNPILIETNNRNQFLDLPESLNFVDGDNPQDMVIRFNPDALQPSSPMADVTLTFRHGDVSTSVSFSILAPVSALKPDLERCETATGINIRSIPNGNRGDVVLFATEEAIESFCTDEPSQSAFTPILLPVWLSQEDFDLLSSGNLGSIVVSFVADAPNQDGKQIEINFSVPGLEFEQTGRILPEHIEIFVKAWASNTSAIVPPEPDTQPETEEESISEETPTDETNEEQESDAESEPIETPVEEEGTDTSDEESGG